MELIRLTNENIDEFLKKPICCLGLTKEYFYEIQEKWDILDNIKMKVVFSTSERKIQPELFGNKFINVYNYKKLKEFDLNKYSLLITDGYYKEIFDNIVMMKYDLDINTNIYFYPNKDTRYYLSYKEKYKNTSLEDMILFRSGPMASAKIEECDFYDNSRALFEYMLENGYNEKYKLVWMVLDPEKYKEKYKKYKNVFFISYSWSIIDDVEKRDRYYHALCLSKWIFFTDAYGFAREAREDQIRVQLWHGCGYKYRINRLTSCSGRFEYFNVISKLYSVLFKEVFKMDEKQMIVAGYPKGDWLFQKPLFDYKKALNIPSAKKYIFWLPTFRTTFVDSLSELNEYDGFTQTGLPIVATQKDLSKSNDLLKELDVELVIKIHPFQDKRKIKCSNYSNIILLDNKDLYNNDIMINQLLTYADALISDYSSVTTEFLMLDRPIAFTVDDLEEYTSNRGFMFDNIHDWLPGREIQNINEFFDFIKMIAENNDYDAEKRRELNKKMLDFNDGNSSKRLIEILGI